MDAIEQRLLAAVCDEPDADGPREVYADWLMGRGDPRGEYIALALARARGVPGVDARRMLQLEQASAGAWIPPLIAQVASAGVGLTRGFVQSISLAAEQWATHGDALIREAPLRHVQLREPHDLAPALEIAATRTLPALTVSSDRQLETFELEGLARVSPLPQLERLTLSSVAQLVDDAGFIALCALRAAPRTLKATRIGIGASGLHALAAGPLGAALEELQISSRQIDDGAVAALGALGTVRRLRLQWSALTAAGVRALLAASPQLVELDLVIARFDAAAIRTWASPHLETLALDGREVRDEQIEALCRIAPAQLPALRHFRLDHANVNTRGVRALVESPLFAQLASIHIGQSPFNQKARQALTAAFGTRIDLAPRRGRLMNI